LSDSATLADVVVPMKLAPWIAGARLRTLPAAVVPVAVGTGVVANTGDVIWGRALLAGVVALTLQIATNFANDYSDGVRGTDNTRVGPQRLVASGTASASAVKGVAITFFGLAAIAGLGLAAMAGWWLIAVGVASIAAGWLYTGGPRPYGYSGLGEVFVFVFFGLVATVGTAYVQLESVAWLAVVASVPVGLLAVALLITNNLRDISGDQTSQKLTVAVRIGDGASRQLYLVCLVGALVSACLLAISAPWVLVVVFAVPFAFVPVRAIISGAEGRALIAVLIATARLQLVVGALLTVGLVLG